MEKLDRILWVGKKPTNGGGDEIYDKKIIISLSKQLDVDKLYISPNNKIQMLTSILFGNPHPRFKYRNAIIERIFRKKSILYDNVVISWESFDFFAIRRTGSSVLILHNVMSDALLEIFKRNIFANLASKQSLFWEKKIYRKRNLKIVVLSKRDERILKQIAPNTPVFVASPGAPPSIYLDNQLFLPEVFISGSYDWYPKRRDFGNFCLQYSKAGFDLNFRHDLPFPNGPLYERLTRDSRIINSGDFSSGLRIGLITDTFLGGFKLKSTFYIANNCMVASMSDIREEFFGAPHQLEFVRFIENVNDIKNIIDEFAKKDSAELMKRWAEFKEYCINRFTWDNSANEILRSISN